MSHYNPFLPVSNMPQVPNEQSLTFLFTSQALLNIKSLQIHFYQKQLEAFRLYMEFFSQQRQKLGLYNQMHPQEKHNYLEDQGQKALELSWPDFDPGVKAFHLKAEDWLCKSETLDSEVHSFIMKEEFTQELSFGSLQDKLRYILKFFITSYGKAVKEAIEQEKKRFSDDRPLLEVFERLEEKYTKSSKCREDMVRFVIRKAITFLKNIFKEKHQVSAKAATMLLCQRYFPSKVTELRSHSEFLNEDAILDFLLPYKKNSRNKTANSNFVAEIFTSELFYNDFLEYLSKLDDILEEDNKKKEIKFISFLVDCVQQNRIWKIKTYKRLPWLNIWLETTKTLAIEIFNAQQMKPGLGGSKKNPKIRS